MRHFLISSLLLIAVSVSTITGCAGTAFKWSDARRIEQGMPKGQVVQLMGAPNLITARGDAQRYVWVWSNGMTGETRSLAVDFDKEGKAVTVPPIPDEFKD